MSFFMNPSFGAGSNLLGAPASSVLGMPGGIQQQSPSSAGFEPGLLPPPPGQAPQGPSTFNQAPAPSMAPVPGAAPVAPQMPQPMQAPTNPVGMPPPPTESMAIVKALTSRLSSLTKAEEMQKTQQI